MIYKFLMISLLSLLSLSVLADDVVQIQIKIKNEYGECYRKFNNDIAYCRPSSCIYPDVADAQAWKAQVIRGMVNGACYVIYYSYIGNSVIGSPLDCFYNHDQQQILTKMYNSLFNTNSAIGAITLKDQITQLNLQACKKRSATQ